MSASPGPSARRAGSRWTLAAGLVLVACLAASWGQPVLEAHGFRQAQTLVSSAWMLRGDPWWLYSTPVLGHPWAVPFEFPLYQWGVALLAMAGLGLDDAGRLLSALAMLACAWPLRAVLRGLGAPERLVGIATVLFLVAPIHVFWGRAAMIESTALLLALLFVHAIQRLVAGPSAARCAVAIALAVLAALVKVTTFFAFALLAGGIVLVALVPLLRARRIAEAISLAALAAAPILAAFVALQAWLQASDAVKSASVLAEFSTSANLRLWNINQGPLALPGPFWRDTVMARMLPDILGHAAWGLPALVVLALPGRRRWLAWATIAIGLFLAPILVFANLHFVHDYYQMANATFLVVALAAVLHGVSHGWSLRGASALAGVASIAMLAHLAADGWPTMRRDLAAHPALAVARVLRANTAPDDVVVTTGLAWSSEMPYYAARRAVMLLDADTSAFVPPALRAPGGGTLLRVGGIVRCGGERPDITPFLPLMCGPLREIEAGGCSIVLRRDAGPSGEDEAGCEQALARVAGGALAPRPRGGLALGPFGHEVLRYRGASTCNIEAIAGGDGQGSVVAAGGSLAISGWFLSGEPLARPTRPMLRLRSEALGRSWYAPLERVVPRPDLRSLHGDAALDGGFRTRLFLDDLPAGRYDLMLVDLDADAPVLCRTGNRSIEVR